MDISWCSELHFRCAACSLYEDVIICKPLHAWQLSSLKMKNSNKEITWKLWVRWAHRCLANTCPQCPNFPERCLYPVANSWPLSISLFSGALLSPFLLFFFKEYFLYHHCHRFVFFFFSLPIFIVAIKPPTGRRLSLDVMQQQMQLFCPSRCYPYLPGQHI